MGLRAAVVVAGEGCVPPAQAVARSDGVTHILAQAELPLALWRCGQLACQTGRMASNRQLLGRSQMTLHEPWPSPGPVFSLRL